MKNEQRRRTSWGSSPSDSTRRSTRAGTSSDTTCSIPSATLYRAFEESVMEEPCLEDEGFKGPW